MGYAYEGGSQEGFRLPRANVDRFRRAIVAGTGDGFWEGAPPPDPDNLGALLGALDWEYEQDAAGDIVGLTLGCDKHPDGDVVEEALVGLVGPGSALHFRGEGGEEWLRRYGADDCEEISGVTLFPALGEQAVILDWVEMIYILDQLPPGPMADAVRARLPAFPTVEP